MIIVYQHNMLVKLKLFMATMASVSSWNANH